MKEKLAALEAWRMKHSVKRHTSSTHSAWYIRMHPEKFKNR